MANYPKYLYHRDEDPVVVNNPEEHAALGSGWEETPAAFEDAEVAPKKKRASREAPKE